MVAIATMRAMAEAAGLRVHVYASPHLCRFNERIRLAGSLIADGALADLLEEVETANGDTPMTFFEVTTAAAFLAFSRVDADLLLLETGLGGALDSTNVLDSPAATVITRENARNAAAVVTSKKVTGVSPFAVSTSSRRSASAPSGIRLPARRMRSLKRQRWGEA